jgi:hypothetical protein
MTDEISLSEAVEQIIKHTGMTRRQVKRRLLNELKTGRLKATGMMVRTGPGGEQVSSGRREDISKEFWKGK